MKHQKISLIIFFTGLFVAAMLFGNDTTLHSVSQAQTKTPAAQSPALHITDCDNSPLADLDTLIQLRFHERDVNFGIRRVLPTTYHQRENAPFAAVHFAPRNDEELLVRNSLQEEGWKIGLFLVGRSILEKKPAQESWDNPKADYYARKPINNPILITPQTKAEELPQAWELWDEAQKAMTAFSKNKQQYDFTMGQWEVSARPIRATEASCLQCHRGDATPNWVGHSVVKLDLSATDKKTEKVPPGSTLKIGDPLGIALYTYKQK